MLTRDWLSHPWFEKFLPDHLKPVDDHIFSDPHGLVLIEDTERALERLIQHGKQVKSSQTYKKNGKTFHFRLKINQKRMKLLSYETPKSEAAIKKRIIIEYLRKTYVTKSRRASRLKEASIQYIKNGQTFVRSIKKSRHFEQIFSKLETLDDALLRGLIDKPAADAKPASVPHSTQDKDFIQSSEEPLPSIRELKEFLIPHCHQLETLLENRLKRLLEEAEQIAEVFDVLDVEEKYIVKRLLKRDIPSLIQTYLSLPHDKQTEQTEPLYETLTKMELNIRSIREKTEDMKIEKMEQLLRLYDKRYPSKQNNENNN
ncbi:hypothetical protein SAMN05192534_101469 [Alteribacillus persepolensis]|uniref:Uncharacterized protein n=1 Tax=Alteribacillus persepolensis TaxID=568899 RepID=A0A1G7ZA97_9BACI|nr:hypothetical protein [Alteribacillus persepolensis]SDH05671.1 hypothetical protein SAMN05192534_101469 [Alteribacillus persepolensis]